jgi:clan AA aspartic protease
MNGLVDLKGRALLTVEVRAAQDAPASPFEAWIDTGFTGELVMPRSQIQLLGLTRAMMVDAILADGRTTRLDAFVGWINWFGELREIEILANKDQSTLLGVGMMLGHRLVVDYHTLWLTLE